MQCTSSGICLGAPHGISLVGCWTGTGFWRGTMQNMHMIYMYLYKRYVGDQDKFICYLAPVQNPVPPHLAFASARLMALRRLVARRALDLEQELCSICICPGPLHTSYTDTYIYHMHILHSSSSKSSARPATNRRNATRRAEANAKWGALHFGMRNISDTQAGKWKRL